MIHDNIEVEFDGHLWRGHPPVEVFQEIKGNYSHLEKPFFRGIGATDAAIAKWTRGQMTSQLEALPAGARLEWIFTTFEELAQIVRTAVRRARFPIDMKFIPLKK
ncbi:hypothetical protein ARTHRO9V_210172 [Arthrobacter sp. 9V]|uniref:hypothetical protein n=1 Tax=Arthrobacter sp. 9V TaxID=2653132 RepID=UPI0012F2073B|nr:hypothetical protein [Arthrobacter sp. 9V]VXC14464.1 hypothetical protein ARTHRO9V_210172 [Arthrobacter sp. 9V]